MASMATLSAVRLFVLCSSSVALIGDVGCLPDPSLPDIFYPFGTDLGDSVAPVNDDGFTGQVPISVGFPFFSSTRHSLYVNTNGAVSFEGGVSTFTPSPFPLASAFSMVAVYWCDVDTNVNNGRIYYRETTESGLLTRASSDVQSAFSARGFGSFQASWVFIATWHNVSYYGGSQSTPTQTFQLILVTDGLHSFALFNYGKLLWTTGTASGGDAATGLGGTAAQVGFNAGDAVNYYAVPFSRTPEIVNIWTLSNVGRTGRWAFRIDNATIASAGCTATTSDVGPSFDCPVLSTPTVINRLWVEFYCTVPTNVTDTRARFEVTFLFDGVAYDDVPPTTLDSTSNVATLHERRLYGKMGKWLNCKAQSYWSDTPTERSAEALSSSYKLGIQLSDTLVTVDEADAVPKRLSITSTIPITCPSMDIANQPAQCQLSLTVTSTSGIAVRQRYIGIDPLPACSYVIAESDWKQSEELAYNAPLEITPKVDPFSSEMRLNRITLSISVLPTKTVNGETYQNPWSDYTVTPVTVYRYDSGSTQVRCTSSGDPRIETFDSLYYSTYSTGQFIYVQTVQGLPFEVQVRHWPCARSVVSCVCGVALREDDVILAADMCTDGVLHYLKFNGGDLPNGAGITTTAGGYSFKIQMPSGNKVIAYAYDWGLNINIYVSSRQHTEGMCGSFDNNVLNDLKVRNTDVTLTLPGDQQAPSQFIDSWRVALGASLFDGVMSDLPRGDPAAETVETFCNCETEPVCGGIAVSDDSSSAWEPNIVVRPRVPAAIRHSRRRRAVGDQDQTDEVDYSYSSSNFTEDQSVQLTLTWPTSTGITEEQAREGCRQRIFDQSVVGPTCYDSLSPENVTTIIQKCVDDVQISGDFAWARDKVPEVQRMCLDAVVSREYAGISDTETLLQTIMAAAESYTEFVCEPQDCNGHGTCQNGTCQCSGDYVGSDCAVSASTVPSIIRLMDPAVCDVRATSCSSVLLQTANTTSSVSCKVVVTKTDSSSQSYSTSAQVTSPNSITCSLPSEPLSLFSNRFNFTAEHGPGYDFNSLPLGGAVLTMALSISNDGQGFSDEQMMKVVDTLCMDCSADPCTQKTTACLIHGYCFSERAENPYVCGSVCSLAASTTWSVDASVACPTSTAATTSSMIATSPATATSSVTTTSSDATTLSVAATSPGTATSSSVTATSSATATSSVASTSAAAGAASSSVTVNSSATATTVTSPPGQPAADNTNKVKKRKNRRNRIRTKNVNKNKNAIKKKNNNKKKRLN